MKNRSQGFSLIELMIVLVVAGILFFVALPAYQNSVLKSNRAAARGVLLDLASRQEQYFINNKEYADALTDLGLPATYYVDNQAEIVAQGDAVYLITLSTVNNFTVSAVPQNRQTKDSQCGTLTYNRMGVKGESGSLSPSECW